MNLITMLIAALVLLPAVVALTWALFAMAQVEKALRSLGGAELMRFGLKPKASSAVRAANWAAMG